MNQVHRTSLKKSYRWLLLGVLLCLAALSALAWSADPDQISWCKFDLPPVYILTGPDAGKGSVDGQIDFFIHALPTYSHRIIVGNIRRITELIRNHEQVVCAGVVKSPERESYMLFSEPYSVTLPPVLIVPRDKLAAFKPYMNANGQVVLERLVTQSKLALGIAAGRSYNKQIDDVLARNEQNPNITVRPAAQDIMAGLMQMMMRERIDYTIIYPFEVKYVLQSIGAKDDFLLLPIEGTPKYVTIHVVAPDDEWGHTVIASINDVIRKHRDDPAFRKNAELWLDDNSRALFRRYIKEYPLDLPAGQRN